MKQIPIQFRMVYAFIVTVLLTHAPVRVTAQEANPVSGASTVAPGQSGTAGTVPNPIAESGLGPSSTTSGAIPSFQAPGPSFGAQPIGGMGLSAPLNGAILPNNGLQPGSISNPGNGLNTIPSVPSASETKQ
jgi:hypothetical protein